MPLTDGFSVPHLLDGNGRFLFQSVSMFSEVFLFKLKLKADS
jgi:hypothetical protein